MASPLTGIPQLIAPIGNTLAQRSTGCPLADLHGQLIPSEGMGTSRRGRPQAQLDPGSYEMPAHR